MIFSFLFHSSFKGRKIGVVKSGRVAILRKSFFSVVHIRRKRFRSMEKEKHEKKSLVARLMERK